MNEKRTAVAVFLFARKGNQKTPGSGRERNKVKQNAGGLAKGTNRRQETGLRVNKDNPPMNRGCQPACP